MNEVLQIVGIFSVVGITFAFGCFRDGRRFAEAERGLLATYYSVVFAALGISFFIRDKGFVVLAISFLFCVGLPIAWNFLLWGPPLIAGHCPHCSYNLTANTSGICPECGTPVEKDDG